MLTTRCFYQCKNYVMSGISVYLAVLCVLLALISFYIMYNYANPSVFPFHTYVTIFTQYCCAFGIILIVPLDLSVTIMGRRSESEKQYYIDSTDNILNSYLTLYWSTLILSNIILVFQEQYNCNGFFTIFTRVRNTCKNLSVQFIAGLIIGTIFFSILVGCKVINFSVDAILLTSILITNTMWSIFLIFLLGYGLIMYPVSVWNRNDLNTRLLKIQYQAAIEFGKLTKSYSDIFLCIIDIKRTKRLLEEDKEENKKLIDAIQILIDNCPIELPFIDAGDIIIKKNINKTSIGSIASYHQKLYWDTAIFTTSQGKLSYLQMKVYFLDDLVNASDETQQISWSFKPIGTHNEYIWYLYIKPILYKIFAVMFGILSICSYLGIMGSIQGIPKNISPYFVIIHSEGITDIQIVFFVLVTIGYTCYITMWSLFSMKLSKVMELVKYNSTWPIPMSINTRILGCLSTPLVFFYLGWIHENRILGGTFENDYEGNDMHTIFSKFYQIKTIPIMGDSSSTFFPVLTMVISFLVMFNYLNKTLISLNCSGMQFDQCDIDNEILEKGKHKLYERKKLIKTAYTNTLNQMGTRSSFFSEFLSGFNEQSKYHHDWMLNNNIDEESNSSIISDEYDSMGSPVKSLVVPSLTTKIGLFVDAFGDYSKVTPV